MAAASIAGKHAKTLKSLKFFIRANLAAETSQAGLYSQALTEPSKN